MSHRALQSEARILKRSAPDDDIDHISLKSSKLDLIKYRTELLRKHPNQLIFIHGKGSADYIHFERLNGAVAIDCLSYKLGGKKYTNLVLGERHGTDLEKCNGGSTMLHFKDLIQNTFKNVRIPVNVFLEQEHKGVHKNGVNDNKLVDDVLDAHITDITKSDFEFSNDHLVMFHQMDIRDHGLFNWITYGHHEDKEYIKAIKELLQVGWETLVNIFFMAVVFSPDFFWAIKKLLPKQFFQFIQKRHSTTGIDYHFPKSGKRHRVARALQSLKGEHKEFVREKVDIIQQRLVDGLYDAEYISEIKLSFETMSSKSDQEIHRLANDVFTVIGGCCMEVYTLARMHRDFTEFENYDCVLNIAVFGYAHTSSLVHSLQTLSSHAKHLDIQSSSGTDASTRFVKNCASAKSGLVVDLVHC